MDDILLVEDSRDDVDLTMRVLRRHELVREVIVVQDGAEALEYLFCEGRYADRDAAQLPGVVLLDLNLPKLNGIEVLRRVRSDDRTRLVPVVMLTTSAEPGDMQACYESGANSYVRKPVDYADFSLLVGEIGRYWLGLNRRPE